MSSNLKKSIAHFFKSVAKNKKLNTYALFLFISFSSSRLLWSSMFFFGLSMFSFFVSFLIPVTSAGPFFE